MILKGAGFDFSSGGEILTETDASGATLNEYIFFAGKRVAMLPASGNPLYYAEDFLGTSYLPPFSAHGGGSGWRLLGAFGVCLGPKFDSNG